MSTTARISALVFVAILLLVAGCVAAQFVWQYTHHRYDAPNTGAYYGHVNASFDSFDSVDGSFFSLHFRGATAPRWRWNYPTNFSYSSLALDWRGDSSEGSATVGLPSLAYTSSSSTGLLTRAVLADWLLGHTNTASADGMRRVGIVFSYIEAAGQGSLPAPRHHPYYLEEPMPIQITHFCLGYGVAGLVYIWMAIWLFLVVILGRRLWRRREGG